ncbi:MAG: hypothetical protein Q4G04_03485 [bacterium]|nr:hypothetical protein [bacterium]
MENKEKRIIKEGCEKKGGINPTLPKTTPPPPAPKPVPKKEK